MKLQKQGKVLESWLSLRKMTCNSRHMDDPWNAPLPLGQEIFRCLQHGFNTKQRKIKTVDPHMAKVLSSLRPREGLKTTSLTNRYREPSIHQGVFQEWRGHKVLVVTDKHYGNKKG